MSTKRPSPLSEASTITSSEPWNTHVRKEFVENSSLSLEARFLYVVLRGFVGPTSPLPFPSLKTLSGIMDRHRESVQKYLAELEAAGFIVRHVCTKGGKFTSTRYELRYRSGNFPLRRFPTTEVSATKDSHSSEGIPEEEGIPAVRFLRKAQNSKSVPQPRFPSGPPPSRGSSRPTRIEPIIAKTPEPRL